MSKGLSNNRGALFFLRMAQLRKPSLEPSISFEDFRVDGRIDFQAYNKAVDEWLEHLKQELREKKGGDLVGEILYFPVGDGYAQYIVVSQKPLFLQHLNVMDGWHVPYAMIRGLRLKDVRQEVEAQRRREELFAKR